MTDPVWTDDRLRERLEAAGIPGVDRILAAVRPSVRLRFLEGEVPLGTSHLGGAADVPEDFEWPTRAGSPLSLLAQFDLQELGSDRLPTEGWLLFFFDAEEQVWGFDPGDRAGFAVRWLRADRSRLVRTLPEGIPEAGDFRMVGVDFQAAPCLPHLEDEVLSEWSESFEADGDEEREEDYEEVLEEISDSYEHAQDGFHLFGHPEIIQNPMRAECHLASQGVYVGNPEGYQSEEAKQLLETGVDDWNLLLQLDSDDDEPGFHWGDTGRLFFWIRDDDLAGCRFDRVWCVLQCY